MMCVTCCAHDKCSSTADVHVYMPLSLLLSGLEEPLRQVSGRAYGPIRAGGTTAAG